MTTRDPQELLPAMGNKYSVEILVATGEPRSAQELSNELDIPIATCYRRIDELTDAKLLEQCDTRIGPNNRHVKVYKRTLDNLSIDFTGSLSVSTPDGSGTGKIDELWRKLQVLPGDLT